MNKYLYLAICSIILSIVIITIFYILDIKKIRDINVKTKNVKDIIVFLSIFLGIFLLFIFFDKKFLKDYIAEYNKEDVRRLYNTIWANGV